MNSIWCLFFTSTSRDWFVSCIISLPARWSWSNESLQQWLYLLNSHLFQSQRSPSNSVSQYTRACIRFVLCNTAFRKILDRWTPHNASCIITKPSKCSSVPDRWCQKWQAWQASKQAACKLLKSSWWVYLCTCIFYPTLWHERDDWQLSALCFFQWVISHCSTAQTLILQ